MVPDIILVLAVLGFTIFLFITEALRGSDHPVLAIHVQRRGHRAVGSAGHRTRATGRHRPARRGPLGGVSASNSFLLPTHQVNALLMGPGGYRNADYMRAGGGMTLLFLIIAVGYIYLFHV
ncbi:MAG: hypothetical protein ACYCY1_00490 [Sulfuriferula sp.]